MPPAAASKARELKKGICADASRRQREDTTIALRKAKREESMSKRRNLAVETDDLPDVPGAPPSPEKVAMPMPTLADIPRLLAEIQSGDPAVVTAATRGWRKLLSIEPAPPVDEVLSTGVVDILARLLHHHGHPDLQFEAAWALTNIASTERTQAVIDAGVVPTMIQLCRSSSPDVREQCIWCLGNIAGDSTASRDMVIGAGALEPMLANIVTPASTSLLRNATWAISNLCRGKPQADLERLRPAIPVLVDLLRKDDVDTLMDACWSLSYLTDGDEARIQAVVDVGACAALAPLLAHESHKVVTPALRTIGNIVTGNDVQTQAALNAGVLHFANSLIRSTKKAVLKETCWLVSNIAAGTPEQTQAVVEQCDLVKLIVEQLEIGDWEVQKEATWVVSNILSSNARAHAEQLVSYGVVKPLCKLLSVRDPKVVLVSLEALEAILKIETFGKGILATTLIDEAGGVDSIETLQEHENNGVYDKAISIIETYFGGDDENSTLAPNVDAAAGTFAFGVAGN
ncbi:armadillo-type protein [Pelagophyceae sp. CCMP2097]|nr:armadillo-type protein [Pelagophyceae sp. CCMP2097]|mmetsp:Transcript_15492/g.54031  ORF Transcript_15492/g.54031 Transcript_15492/m.54031 type:complete len:516 (+) Transcript_15492:84-1631(+)